MPSKSKKQADFMRAIAHSKKFSEKVGVPQSVGKEFVAEDKAKKGATPAQRRWNRKSS